MHRVVAAALACGLSLTGVTAMAGSAHAQAAPDTGMDCVYNALVDSYDIVAEDYLFGEFGESSTKAITTAKTSCAAKHSYAPGQLDAAGDLGVLASAIDYLSEELLFDGVSETAVDGILGVYGEFTDEDVGALFDPDWRNDTAFHGKLKARLVTAGIPDKPDHIDVAMTILEIAALAEETSYVFAMGAN